MEQGPGTGTEPAGHQLTLRQLTDILGGLSDLETDPELELIEIKAGEVLFEQGDSGDCMYVVVAGVLGVRVRHKDGSETVIDKLTPGALVGEMALISGQPRSATVYAMVDTRLIRLAESTYKHMLKADGDGVDSLVEMVKPRWQRVQLANKLNELFGDLNTASLHLLQDQLEWLNYANGDVVFKQGDPGDGMYIVILGRLRVTAQTGDGAEVYIGEILPGQTVGEFALFTDEVRAATAYAVRDTSVVRITPAVFQLLIAKHPELVARITRIIIQRRQQALQRKKTTAPSSLTLMLLPAGPTVDCWQFAQDLTPALAAEGVTLALNSAQFDNLMGQEGIAQTPAGDAATPAVNARLDELEVENKYLLFAADHTLTDWTRRCLGRADRVLLIANPQADAAPGEVEQMLAKMNLPVRRELVLWHPADTRQPQHTLRWLEPRQVHTHYHVRQGDAGHMERLARRLVGKAIALVLSGGSARGYAHLGVHRAMEELNIPVDYIGGTSMGAVMGASMLTHETNVALMKISKQFANSDAIFDPTFPITSIMASRKVTKLTQTLFGDLRIEDLWIPFFCVAANLTTGDPVVIQQGPIWRAVRSSLAIPSVFTPVIEDGETIVDGAVMDNFPAGLMAQFCESERIIGVNVTPLREKKRYYDFDTDISGWRILFSRLNPFSKSLRTPSLVGIMMRTLEIHGLRRSKDEEIFVDLMIFPDVKAIGSQDYDQFEAIAQLGYEAALERLRDWKKMRLEWQSAEVMASSAES